jgi:hypothetical protein
MHSSTTSDRIAPAVAAGGELIEGHEDGEVAP